MSIDPARFTAAQIFELTKAAIIAAGPLAAAYKTGPAGLQPKEFEIAYERALTAVLTGIDNVLRRASS